MIILIKALKRVSSGPYQVNVNHKKNAFSTVTRELSDTTSIKCVDVGVVVVQSVVVCQPPPK